jgi:endonuclease YncB( thermonuclease family)
VHRRRLALATWIVFAVVAALAVTLAFLLGPERRTPSTPGPGAVLGPLPVLDVVDGDTVVLAGDGGRRSVRLIGIDTPEVAHPVRGREPFGPEASAFTAALLPRGTEVWVELDVEVEDAYGRLLAYLYLADREGDWRIDGRPAVMVNEAIARAGFARVLTVAPNGVHAGRIEAAVAAAQAEGRGMFARRADPVAEPEVPRGRASEARDLGSYPIRIACILYDPSTDNDTGGEWVELEVLGPVDTRGMALLDAASGERFPLPAGRYDAGDTIIVGNPGQGVWNNGGDTVHLVIGSGNEGIDAWRYEPVPGQDRVVCR